MEDEIARSLVKSRNYCSDRLVEIKAEIAKLQDEGNALKATLETTVDATQEAVIRRRRRFLSRRIPELKDERERLMAERQSALDQLANLATAASTAPESSSEPASSLGAKAKGTIPRRSRPATQRGTGAPREDGSREVE